MANIDTGLCVAEERNKMLTSTKYATFCLNKENKKLKNFNPFLFSVYFVFLGVCAIMCECALVFYALVRSHYLVTESHGYTCLLTHSMEQSPS